MKQGSQANGTAAQKLDPSDPRVQPAPEGQYKEHRTIRLSNHRTRQLRAEADAVGISRQDIIDTALDEYFLKRYESTEDSQRG